MTRPFAYGVYSNTALPYGTRHFTSEAVRIRRTDADDDNGSRNLVVSSIKWVLTRRRHEQP